MENDALVYKTAETQELKNTLRLLLKNAIM